MLERHAMLVVECLILHEVYLYVAPVLLWSPDRELL